MVGSKTSWTEAETIAIREQLNRMLSCELFAQASRQCRFLEYIVEVTITGQADRLSQFVVGVDVFDRDSDFDPVTDSIVRVEAGRLRSKLAEYYLSVGQNDPIIISLPKGGYGVRFEVRDKVNVADPLAVARASKTIRNLLIALIVIVTAGALYVANVSPIKFGADDENATSESAIFESAECTQEDLEKQSTSPFVAILPFDNMSADPDQEYFSDGITEDIITDVSTISGLSVISRHSTFVYKGHAISIREIGKNLCARYILEGSVRTEGNQLRITAQLIDALTDTHVWADRYDHNFDDVFAIQGEVSRKIVSALKVELTDQEESRLGHVGTSNTAAHDLFLRGRERFYLFTNDDIEQSLDLFSQAIKLDPNYAEAHAWQSRVQVYFFLSGMNNVSEETVVPGIESARRAIELDPLLPMAHANLGWALSWDHQYEAAIASIKTAIELDRSFADAYLWLSMITASIRRGDEALAAIQSGIRVNPNYGVTYVLSLGRAYLALGQNDRALGLFERGVARNPNFLPTQVFRIFALEALGRAEEAGTVREDLSQIFPNFEFSAAYLFYYETEQL